jgi:phage FluMu protein Com
MKKNKMDCKKIYKIRTSKKPKGGYNSLWLIRCNICGEIMLRWDTDMYNKACPCCKNEGYNKLQSKEEIKDKIFKIQEKLYSERSPINTLSAKEVGILSSFRETMFESDLQNLLSDYIFTNRIYHLHRKVEWRISKRGEKLLKNFDFIDLLKECYNLLEVNYKK